MNPFELDATGLMLWGLVAHLIADWPLQNEWMALNKMRRRMRSRVTPPPEDFEPIVGRSFTINKVGSTFSWGPGPWWDRHPSAYVHAGIHGVLLVLVFGWVAVPLALVHLVIDCRWPVARWSRLMRQTQPGGLWTSAAPQKLTPERYVPLFDIGADVRMWNDQVVHIATIAVAALAVGALS